jgi:hypothetical protein
MKNRMIFPNLIILIILSGCTRQKDCRLIIRDMQKEMDAGNLSRVRHLADSVRSVCPDNLLVLNEADSLARMADRISLDFSLSEDQVNEQLEKRAVSFSKDEKLKWEEKGWLEYMVIDGKKMFFRRTVSNLMLLKKFHEDHEPLTSDAEKDPELIFRLKHTSEAFKLSGGQADLVAPADFAITYSITVHPDAVPEGETVRCWMPWPKSNHPRQQKVKLLSTSNPEYIISPDTAIHSALYMEEKARKGIPTTFLITFSYESAAQHFDLSGIKTVPYDKESALFRKYTSQQLPQITFRENVKHLADSIAGGEEDPVEITRRLYLWFKENIPWTGALEYSILPDIPGYVMKNRRGDCGMQTLLYISMLRYKGIPVRWQSGWMIPPGSENLHDWCEIYFEGAGWVPSDVSYDLQNSEIKEIREYYLSGTDSYRMIVNDGISGNLYPLKQHMRSEPYDFQRGEVEWKGGNLYFDKWDYDIKINYLK